MTVSPYRTGVDAAASDHEVAAFSRSMRRARKCRAGIAVGVALLAAVLIASGSAAALSLPGLHAKAGSTPVVPLRVGLLPIEVTTWTCCPDGMNEATLNAWLWNHTLSGCSCHCSCDGWHETYVTPGACPE
jgi:hypothetical protein